MSIATVILAAGGAQRMGQPKQLLPVGGQPMLARVVQTACAARLGLVIVVLGAARRQIAPLLAGYPITIVANTRWRSGMASSLCCGLRRVPADVDAALFVPGDMPNLRPDHLQAIAARFSAGGATIVIPTYGGRRGNPVLFARTLFPELCALSGDQGGRALFHAHAAEIATLELDDGVLCDIDTPADYARLAAAAPVGE